jgi:hypothetical protein
MRKLGYSSQEPVEAAPMNPGASLPGAGKDKIGSRPDI